VGANRLQLILGAAKESPYYILFFTLAYTGLRRGELLGLRWGDIDLEKATLSVVQTLQQLRNGEYIFGEPKSKPEDSLGSHWHPRTWCFPTPMADRSGPIASPEPYR